MRRGKGTLPHPLVVSTTAALLALALLPGMGSAAKDPVSDVTDSVGEAAGEAIDEVTGGLPSGGSHQAPSDPTEDDSEGHESPDPSGPDHASGEIADVSVEGNDAVTVAQTNSTIEDDDSSSSDVTVLAIGGEEIVGAHSDSGKGPKQDSVDPLAPICEGSEGGICLGLLFADASSTENSNSSSASGSAALAFACLGGTQSEEGSSCGGPVGAGVSESNSDIKRNKKTGQTEASHSNDAADVCIGGEADPPAEGGEPVCSGIGAQALHSESTSNSGKPNGKGTTERDSYVLGLDAGGERQEIIGDPTDLSIPPGCPEETSLVCIFFNQGESFVFTGGAAGHQETVHLDLGPILAHLATSETLATNDGPDEDVVPVSPRDDAPKDKVLGTPSTPGSDDVLPFTGIEIALFLALALGLISLGAWLLALQRRPEARG